MPGVGDPGLGSEDPLAGGILDYSPADGDLVDDPREDVLEGVLLKEFS